MSLDQAAAALLLPLLSAGALNLLILIGVSNGTTGNGRAPAGTWAAFFVLLPTSLFSSLYAFSSLWPLATGSWLVILATCLHLRRRLWGLITELDSQA